MKGSSSPTASSNSNSSYNDTNEYHHSNNNNKNGILIANLTKSYSNFKAVDSLSIQVNAGDIFGFLGPNGAGKTTTIRILCGLLLPTTGTAKVAGYDIVKDSVKIRNIVGLLPESSGFYNWMNAKEYLLHFAALYRINEHEAKNRVNELLEKVGLADNSFAPIGYYSRGMKQRLGLARTLINDPQILFLDEPTLGLDPKGQIEIQKFLLNLNRERGVTIFLSSHALGEVSTLCNRIAILNHGRLVAQGTMDELRELVMRDNEQTTIQVRVLRPSEDIKLYLSKLPFSVRTISNNNNDNIDNINSSDKLISLVIQSTNDSSNDIIGAIHSSGLQIYDIHRSEMNLDEIFLRLIEAEDVYNKNDNKEYQLQPQKKEQEPLQQRFDALGITHHKDNNHHSHSSHIEQERKGDL